MPSNIDNDRNIYLTDNLYINVRIFRIKWLMLRLLATAKNRNVPMIGWRALAQLKSCVEYLFWVCLSIKVSKTNIDIFALFKARNQRKAVTYLSLSDWLRIIRFEWRNKNYCEYTNYRLLIMIKTDLEFKL